MQVEIKNKSSKTYRYLKVKDANVFSVDKGFWRFMYIGNDKENLTTLRTEFDEEISVMNLETAKSTLKELSISNDIPNVIFIDFSFQMKDLQLFVKFLGENALLASIPVILNSRVLSKVQASSSLLRSLVDDIVDFKVGLVFIHKKVEFLKRVKSELIMKKSTIKPEYKPFSVYKQNYLLKRGLDILLALFFLIMLFPVFIFIAFAITVETRGPVFYNSYRAGRGYYIFKFFKFRTMKVGADRMVDSIPHLNKYNNFGHAPLFFKVDNDPRITKVGQVLRNSGLDELPQLWNVLIGDMSIVGNRPLPLYESSALTTNEWAERFVCPAGITGLWQVNFRYSKNFTSYDRINMDISYSKNTNIIKDIVIIIYTPIVLVKGLFSNNQNLVNKDKKVVNQLLVSGI